MWLWVACESGILFLRGRDGLESGMHTGLVLNEVSENSSQCIASKTPRLYSEFLSNLDRRVSPTLQR